jgi:hypothetical protein
MSALRRQFIQALPQRGFRRQFVDAERPRRLDKELRR